MGVNRHIVEGAQVVRRGDTHIYVLAQAAVKNGIVLGQTENTQIISVAIAGTDNVAKCQCIGVRTTGVTGKPTVTQYQCGYTFRGIHINHTGHAHAKAEHFAHFKGFGVIIEVTDRLDLHIGEVNHLVNVDGLIAQ
ncbi:hypothetical protein XMG48_002385 [Marinobacterium sp. xm-g-48]|nr:hypothetical protein [Marinobacterium sp. xm-g-48]